MLTMIPGASSSISSNPYAAIKEFAQDMDVTEHLDIVKSEMYGDLMHGLNSLEYMATQYETLIDGENLLTCQNFTGYSLRRYFGIGHEFIDHCDMIDFTIFPKYPNKRREKFGTIVCKNDRRCFQKRI